ncbi:MAG: PDZ domain-containing protein [Myxococcales bacterium]|nr:PDZ domain-containing protein [Myxococcales bacterium]
MSPVVRRRLLATSGPAIAVVAVALSAWFAVAAAAELRAVEPVSPPVAVTSVAPPPPPVALDAGARPGAAGAAAGAALLARNMFCSTCPPAAGDGGDAGSTADVAPRPLPRLIATHTGSPGWATLEAAGVAGAFTRGAALPGGGVLDAVEPGAIVIRFGHDATVRVSLADAVATAPAPESRAAPASAASSPWADRVRAVGEGRWEVDRMLLRELVAAGTGGAGGAAARGVRLQPVGAAGKLAGVKVAMARPGSLAHVLGLEAGDVIEAVDGRAIDSPAMLMDLYGRMGDLRRVDLGVRRKGAARTLIYDLP